MSGRPYTTLQARQAYQTVIDLAEIRFISGRPSIEVVMQKLTHSPKSGTLGWTDAYLAAFASLASLRLVSFDEGFTRHGGGLADAKNQLR